MASYKKFALVTGGSRRIGASISRRLHRSGINIMIHYRHSKDDAVALQSELNNIRKNSAFVVQADFLEPESYEYTISETIQSFGGMDFLINNASSYYPTKIGNISLAQWEDLISTNLKTPLFLSQCAATYLKKTKGAIVNITDAHIQNPKEGYSVYSIAKSGLSTLTKSLAKDLGPDIRVNAVAPGAIIWPDNKQEFDKIYRENVINNTALRRIGEPDDVAKAVEYLLLNAPFVTGETINVDGGSW
ncbi:MAG: pteridine reductase [Methylophilales bacterium]|nr:pteridine reductase [Methylophilales bacterium]